MGIHAPWEPRERHQFCLGDLGRPYGRKETLSGALENEWEFSREKEAPRSARLDFQSGAGVSGEAGSRGTRARGEEERKSTDCSHGCVHATRPILLLGWRQSDCCCCPRRCFSSHPPPHPSAASLNGKPNLWNKWDCGRSVKWWGNHGQCGSIHPQGGEIPPACQTAGLTVHPYYRANRGSLWRRLQSPRKMLWLFWVNISMALRGKYVVNFEICLDFRYFVCNHITVPKKGSNFSFPSNL